VEGTLLGGCGEGTSILSEIDLRDAEGLRAACEQAQIKLPDGEWERDLAVFLDKVAAASEAEREAWLLCWPGER